MAIIFVQPKPAREELLLRYGRPISALGMNDSGGNAGGGGSLELENAVFVENGNLIHLVLSGAPTHVSTLGWSITINAVPEGLLFDNFSGVDVYFNTIAMSPTDVVLISYDQDIGDTVRGGSLLKSFTDVKAENVPVTLSWAAGTNYATLSNISEQYIMQLQSVGVGVANPNTPELTLPDYQGIWRTQKAGKPAWYGSRVVDSGLTDAVFYGDDELGDPLPEQPWLYVAQNFVQRSGRTYKLLNWAQQGTCAVDQVNPIGMTGVAGDSSVLTDADTGASVARFFDVPHGSQFGITLRFFIKKDDIQTTQPGLGIAGAHGWAAALGSLNMSTGAWNQIQGTFANVSVDLRAGDWWEVCLELNHAGQSTTQQKIWPAISNGGGIDNTLTGTVHVGNAELLDLDIIHSRGAALMQNNNGTHRTYSACIPSFSILNHSNTQGAYFMEWKPQYASTDIEAALFLIDVTNGVDMGVMGATTLDRVVRSYDGTSVSEITSPFSAKQSMKMASVYEAGVNKTVNLDNVYSGDGAYNGSFNVGGTFIRLLQATVGVALIRNIRRYNLGYVAGKAKIDELMA